MLSKVLRGWTLCILGACLAEAADVVPAPQRFKQEIARSYTAAHGLPQEPVQLVHIGSAGRVMVFCDGRWFALDGETWHEIKELKPASESEFVFPGTNGAPVKVPLPWRNVRQFVCKQDAAWVGTETNLVRVDGRLITSVPLPRSFFLRGLAVGDDGRLLAGGTSGLYEFVNDAWFRVAVPDKQGRRWAARDVACVALDSDQRIWFGIRAGVACKEAADWRFYEGKDGLPWSEFTCVRIGTGGEIWFGTTLGAIMFDGKEFHYRQGPRWLPNDNVNDIAVSSDDTVWFATSGGVGSIRRVDFTLAKKAAFYEDEIERYIKRTPFGYVAEAALRVPGDKSTANPQDSDNDGLWTAMYGAGQCFAYAATRDPKAKERARKAFEALRFLQKVTQGGTHSPPKGFVARTIRSVDLPNPNTGRLEADREQQKHDSLWKVYEPRWPLSEDRQWYWKSDTSSDELDGHYFFYPLYFDFCADTETEKERVREVVRDLTDHLLEHGLVLVDHDGRPTRWAIYAPEYLNRDPRWYPERGLNSLSILSYLAVAAHVTDDSKYTDAAKKLIDQHGYHQNAMYPKVQFGPGSGNQSDDEMAFMCYYNLLRYAKDENLKAQIRFSLFSYWANEAPEMNPLFNFICAAHCTGQFHANPFGRFPITPWEGWLDDAMRTLRGFSLDRINWPHQNSHRLDVVRLHPPRSIDPYDIDRRPRGYRANGKVLPVENRHFNHWNTDPWTLDYRGDGNELASGTVFLLPYYMGLYHGFIEKP